MISEKSFTQATTAFLQKLKSEELHNLLKSKTCIERGLLAEIIGYIQEVDRRKLYFKYNCTSLFQYLTQEMKYSTGSAQRRIDAARLLNDVPEVKESLECGELTLNQISIVSMGLKQAKKESNFTSTVEVKRELISKVKAASTEQAQKAVAEILNLEIKTFEKKLVQRDESVRVELTFTKKEMTEIQEMREWCSHAHANASIKEILMLGLVELKKKKSPIKRAVTKDEKRIKNKSKVTSAVELNDRISQPLRRKIFENSHGCQWTHPNGQICGSKFQLQIDHKKSKWLGGTNDEKNLQVLCSIHNRLKYQMEVGLI